MRSPPAFRAIEEEPSVADVEMAQRLLGLNRAPQPALVARIRAIPHQSQPLKWGVPRLAWGLAVLLGLLVILVLASPSVHDVLAALQEAISAITTGSTEYRMMSLDTAGADVPFEFYVPRKAPAGWTRRDEVTVGDTTMDELYGSTSILVQWTRPGYQPIFLRIVHGSGDLSLPMACGPSSFWPVEIDGESAMAIRTGWTRDPLAWGQPPVTTLLWTVEDVQYALCTSDPAVSQHDLVMMADSAR